MMLDEKLLTYREVAEVLRCSERTVQNRVKNGHEHHALTVPLLLAQISHVYFVNPYLFVSVSTK